MAVRATLPSDDNAASRDPESWVNSRIIRRHYSGANSEELSKAALAKLIAQGYLRPGVRFFGGHFLRWRWRWVLECDAKLEAKQR
jgi:hypothetical protein